MSGPWYTGSKNGVPLLEPAGTNTFTWGGGAGTNTASTGFLWMYVPGQALTNDGDSLTLRFSLRSGGAALNENSGLRFGLLDDGGSRLTHDLNGSNTDAAFLPARGYAAMWNVGPGIASGASILFANTDGASNPLSTSSGSALLTRAPLGAGLQTGAWAEAWFRIARVSSTHYELASALNGVKMEAQTAALGVVSFNMVGIQNTVQTGFDALELRDLQLERASLPVKPPPDVTGKPNVLLICVDDLRPETRAYGCAHMVTPRMDRLAEEGRLFRRHYCQSPTCGASRYAMLTGLRYAATDSGNSSNEVMWSRRPSVPPAEPWNLVDCFRRNGYRTVAMGKISHSADGYHYEYGDAAIPATPDREEMPFSWDQIVIPPAFTNKWGTGWKAFFGYADGSTRVPGVSPPLEIGHPERVDGPVYPDVATADAAIAKLHALRTNRFFLAVGFYKPHLPFTAPQSCFDLYATNSLPFPPLPVESVGVSARTQTQSEEPVSNYGHAGQPADWHDRTNTAYHVALRQAYCACVSFTDAQVGRVLDTLDALGLGTNTIVVLWGDHGWHLGDHNLWGKHTKYERSARSALIVRTPKMRFPGHATDALVESIDIYPTLAALCALTNPPPPAALGGASFAAALDDPRAAGKEAAITYWSPADSLRTDRYRLIHYRDNGTAELFDHVLDPQEGTNRAGDAAYASVLSHLVALSVSNAPAALPQPDHYADWITSRFPSGAWGDGSTVGRLQDPDGDGLPNVVEYYRGTCPTSFTAAATLRPLVAAAAGGPYFAVRFDRSLYATDVRSSLRSCDALAQPSWETVDADDLRYRVSRAVTGMVETITVRDALPLADRPRRFTQLQLNWDP